MTPEEARLRTIYYMRRNDPSVVQDIPRHLHMACIYPERYGDPKNAVIERARPQVDVAPAWSPFS